MSVQNRCTKVVQRLGEGQAMISIKMYAKSHSVSYESVRKQIKRYEEELQDHTTKINGALQLDEYACEFLDKHRQPKSIVVSPDNEETQQEIKKLYIEIDRLKDVIINLQKEQKQYIEDKAKSDALLLIADKEHEELEKAHKELETVRIDLEVSKSAYNTLNNEKEQIQTELEKYKPTLFGLYRKI